MNINAKSTLLEVKNLSFSYGVKKIIKNVSFKLKEGESIGIIGESGSGKSSLLKLISGLLQPDSGSLKYKSEPIKGPDKKLIPGHDDIKLVSQDFDLMPYLSVEENILRDALSYGGEARKRFTRYYGKTLKLRSVTKNKAGEISGGQKQRTTLASALISSPELLLLDEPFSNLDYVLKQDIIDMLKEEWKQGTMVVVAHEPSDIMQLADKLVVLKGGRIIQRGTVEEVFRNPKNEYVAGLLGPVNVLSEDEADILGAGAKKFIRPNEFIILEKGSGVRVTVRSCTYLGSFYELNAESSEGSNLKIHQSKKYLPGETMIIRLAE